MLQRRAQSVGIYGKEADQSDVKRCEKLEECRRMAFQMMGGFGKDDFGRVCCVASRPERLPASAAIDRAGPRR